MHARGFLALLALVLAFAPTFARAETLAACKGPFCEMDPSLERYRDMSPEERIESLVKLRQTYRYETDLEVLRNVASFAEKMGIVLRQFNKDEPSRDQIRLLRQAVLVRLVELGQIEPEFVADYYLSLPDESARQHAIESWRTKVAVTTDRESLGKLVWFLFMMRSLSESMHDSWQTIAAARAAELEAVRTKHKLFPPAPIPTPGSGGTGGGSGGAVDPTAPKLCEIPKCDAKDEIEKFRSMRSGLRYLLSDELVKAYAQATDLDQLAYLRVFGRALHELFIEVSEKEWTVRLASQLHMNALSGLIKNLPVTSDKLATYFEELKGEILRYPVLVAMRGKAKSLSTREELEALASFFVQARAVVTREGEPDYIIRETKSGEAEALERLKQLTAGGTPPTPTPTDPVVTPTTPDTISPTQTAPEPTPCLNGPCDIVAVTAKFRAMSQGGRYSTLSKLRLSIAGANDSTLFERLAELGGALVQLFYDIKEEDWMLREAQGLRNDAIFKITRTAAVDASKLSALYREIKGESVRYAVLTNWRLRARSSNVATELREWIKLFAACESISQLDRDADYLAREAASAQAELHEKLQTV